MCAVHPVFHVSMLKPSTPNPFPDWTPTPNPLIIIVEYKISEVLDLKINKHRRCKLLYLVQWAGYKGANEETSWLPAFKLGHALEYISNFHHTYPDKPGPDVDSF